MKRWSRKKSLAAICRFDIHRQANQPTEKDWDQLFFAIWSIEDWILGKYGVFRKQGLDLHDRILMEIAHQSKFPVPLYFIATNHLMSQLPRRSRWMIFNRLDQPIPTDLFRPICEDGDRPCVARSDFRTGPDTSGNDFWGLGF